ncbi:MAG: DUF1778 domain-containing protein [Coriobacteriia bacterium]|nr:DUF1778 domain-containing protein [Coriobacteriia bacterium]
MATEQKTKTLALRVTEAQLSAIKDFAEFNGTTVTAFMMDSAWKQIEEFEDIRDAEAVIDAGRTPLEWDKVQALAGLA